MTDTIFSEEAAETVRRYYQAGRCPCCGSGLYEWRNNKGDVFYPEAIGEEVLLCGRCIANEHQIRPPEVVQWILQSLAKSPRR